MSINTGVEKNELHLNIDWNFDHQLSLKVRVGIQTIVYNFKVCCSINTGIEKMNNI